MRRLRLPAFGDRSVPILLIVLGVLAYGLLLPSLGFFWDDWPNAWFLHVLGPGGFPSAFASDRPVIGYFYLLTTSWLGENPLAWQVFAIACRVVSAMALWWVLRMAWPRHPKPALWVAMLFLVYPSFKQQHIAIIYSHFFLLLAIHLASLALMLLAVAHPRRRIPLTIAALLTQALSLFAHEYSISLEVLRPVLLWAALTSVPPSGSRGLRFARWWTPCLGLTVLYLYWRVAILGFPTYQPGLLAALAIDPGNALAALFSTIAQDLAEVLALTWRDALIPPDPAVFGPRATLLVAAAGLGALIASAGFLRFYHPGLRIEASAPAGPRWSVRVMALGLVMLIAAGSTAWITKLPIGLTFPWDRLTLPLMLGACLVIGGLLSLLPRSTWVVPAALGLLLGLAVASQVQAGFTYRRDWELQRDFFWQLAWRAPALRPGTVLFTNDIPLTYESDNSLTAPLNWIYADDLPQAGMSYLLYYVSLRQGLGLPALEPDLPIEQWYRPTTFSGNTSQSLAVLSKPPGCLQILDEVYHDSMPTIPPDLSRAVTLANLDWIEPQGLFPEAKLLDLFGPEPAHDWCYFFERADLARQRGDWVEVAAIGAEALRTGDEPNDASEWLPFIEASARTGDVGRAVEWSNGSLLQNPAVRPMLCRTWGRILPDLAAGPDQERAGALVIELGCD